MADIPIGDFRYFVGIDPGKYGGIVCLSMDGSLVEVHDMPMLKPSSRGKDRKYDLPALWSLIRGYSQLPKVLVGLENPTTRPGEGAERARWFGEGIGYLRMALVASGVEHCLISPNLWKGRLGIPGKTDKDANKIACETFALYYPSAADQVRYPSRHSGRADAGLIAHFLRTRTGEGMRAVVGEHGRDSLASLMLAFGRRSRKKKKGGLSL
jgi:hypothetical protein